MQIVAAKNRETRYGVSNIANNLLLILGICAEYYLGGCCFDYMSPNNNESQILF
jgi:hypothetical protein